MQDEIIEGEEYHLWQGDIYEGIGRAKYDYRLGSYLFRMKMTSYGWFVIHTFQLTHWQKASKLTTI